MIVLKNISKTFEDKIILKDLSLTFEKGGINFIIGKSGVGKTTLLNIIGGLENPEKGDILYDGTPLKRRQIFKEVSFVFQNFGLLENETVIDNFIKLDICTDKKRINESLKKVGLENVTDQKVYKLSGGEQQRVAIAKCLLKDSSIILADEPTGNLDKENTRIIIDLLRKIANEKLVIVVTHNLDLIEKSKGDTYINL